MRLPPLYSTKRIDDTLASLIFHQVPRRISNISRRFLKVNRVLKKGLFHVSRVYSKLFICYSKYLVFGLAEYRKGESFNSLCARADEEMYRIKREWKKKNSNLRELLSDC